jgi:hypothetical protein
MVTKTANLDAAHRLVRGLALCQQMLHSAPVNITHVAGLDNNLADIASQAITQLDDDHAFLTHFDTLFPLQEQSWQHSSPTPAQLCNVISTLRGQGLTAQRWTLQLGPPAGAGGSNTAPIVEQIRGCGTQHPRSAASYSWALPPGLELDSLGKAGRLEPKPSKRPCIMWHKPSCWKDTQTPDKPAQESTWLCPLPTSLNPFVCETPPPNPKQRCRFTQLTLQRPLVTTLTPRLAKQQRRTLYLWLFTSRYALSSIRSLRSIAPLVLYSFESVTSGFGKAKLCFRPAAMQLSFRKMGIVATSSTRKRLTAIFVQSISMAQGMPLSTPISFLQPGIHVQLPHILFAIRHGAKLA